MRLKDSRPAGRLATAPRPLEERFADVKATRMRYFTGGRDGPPVVLVHGLGGSASNWYALTALLAPRYRLLVPELPGHGASAPLPAASTLAPYADRVAALAEREGCLPAVVVGHSLGGLIAIRLAVRRPGAVRAVVVAGAAGISSTSRRAQKALALSVAVKPGRRIAPFRHAIARSPTLRGLVLGWGVADRRRVSKAIAESFLESPALYTDVASAAKALVGEDVREVLGGLRCPVAVLWGARDVQTRVADAFDYARRTRGRLRVIADCGHLLIAERPDACAEAIDDFVASLAGHSSVGGNARL